VSRPLFGNDHFGYEDSEVRPADGVIFVVFLGLAGQDSELSQPDEREVKDVVELIKAGAVLPKLFILFLARDTFELQKRGLLDNSFLNGE